MTRRPRVWMVYSNLLTLLSRRTAVIAQQENACILLLLLKRLGLTRKRLIVLNVALLKPENRRGINRWLWRQLLHGADTVVSYARGQLPLLARDFRLPDGRLRFMPYGVDTAFFTREARQREALVIAVGGHPGRDYVTFVKAILQLDGTRADMYCDHIKFAELQRAFPALPARIGLYPATLSFHELRALYRRAAVGVVPLHDVSDSAGQTVLLEMMACATPVVVSGAMPIADYVEDGVTGLVVPPANEEAMALAINRLLNDRTYAEHLGYAAAERVRERFSSDEMGRRLLDISMDSLPR